MPAEFSRISELVRVILASLRLLMAPPRPNSPVCIVEEGRRDHFGCRSELVLKTPALVKGRVVLDDHLPECQPALVGDRAAGLHHPRRSATLKGETADLHAGTRSEDLDDAINSSGVNRRLVWPLAHDLDRARVEEVEVAAQAVAVAVIGDVELVGLCVEQDPVVVEAQNRAPRRLAKRAIVGLASVGDRVVGARRLKGARGGLSRERDHGRRGQSHDLAG